MGPRAGLDRCGKSLPPPGFDHRTVQPLASRYSVLYRDKIKYTSSEAMKSCAGTVQTGQPLSI